jgi:hypothetical protein
MSCRIRLRIVARRHVDRQPHSAQATVGADHRLLHLRSAGPRFLSIDTELASRTTV